MSYIQIIQNHYISVIAGGVGGVFTSWLSQKIINKRGTFAYNVTHQNLGTTVEDPLFGNVTIQLNGNPIHNLYLSTVELRNESMNDYENIIVNIYTDDATLMSERVQLIGSPRLIEWSDRFKKHLHVKEGDQPTQAQQNVYNGQREYLIPVINRGQSITFTLLNSTKDNNSTPNIWASITRKGVKLKYRTPRKIIFGVPHLTAALTGIFIGALIIFGLGLEITNLWVVSFVALTLGFFAEFPGAGAIKLARKIKDIIGG